MLLISLFVCFQNFGVNYNLLVSFTSFCIISIAIFNVFKIDGKPYSLNKVFFLFVLFFFGLAPILQFKNNISIWTNEKLLAEDYIWANVLIIFIIAIYKFFYWLFGYVKIKKIINLVEFSESDFHFNRKLILVSVSLFCLYLVFYLSQFSLISLLIRGYGDSELESTANLMFHFFVRPIPAICLLLYKLKRGSNFIVEFLLLIIVLVTCFPTGIPRLQVAALYIPLLFVYVKSLQKNFNFSIILIFGVLLFFPFFNLFRAEYIEGLTGVNLSFVDINMFLQGHFDNYQNFVRVIKADIITWGSQLFGVLFFFIPRNIWTTKPVNSGVLISEELNLYFDNISVNFFAEGYINFGFLGILFFIVIIAYLNSRMDSFFWSNCMGDLYNNPLFSSLYLVVFGMEFFILRGALLSAYPITLGLVSAVYISYFLIKGPFLRKFFVALAN
jgi:hypothetical protein